MLRFDVEYWTATFRLYLDLENPGLQQSSMWDLHSLAIELENNVGEDINAKSQ